MEGSERLSKYRFLIVEDEALQACHLATMLTEMGGTVTQIAYGYDQARNAMYDAQFDCAILDINLGGTLAFPLIDVLRRQGIPFVICTAYADAVDVYPGARDAPRLAKPVDPNGLTETVLGLLSDTSG